MSAIAHVQNGQVINQTTAEEKQKAAATPDNALDKDAFLQLLVTQMKYQDPLQPTSNTEYISQLANFSELEEMQNINTGMEMQRASGLVGQYVFMRVTDSNGHTTYPEGQVDYVVYQNGKTYLSINETLYDINDLDTVADSEYMVASRLYESFTNELSKLPKVEHVGKNDLEDIKKLLLVYDNMTVYQRSFITPENMSLLEKYAEKYKELTATETENGNTEGAETESDNA